MKPNEIMGAFGFIGMIVAWVVSYETAFNIWTLVVVALFGFVHIAGFSLWGIWTFNPWVEKLTRNRAQ